MLSCSLPYPMDTGIWLSPVFSGERCVVHARSYYSLLQNYYPYPYLS